MLETVVPFYHIFIVTSRKTNIYSYCHENLSFDICKAMGAQIPCARLP